MANILLDERGVNHVDDRQRSHFEREYLALFLQSKPLPPFAIVVLLEEDRRRRFEKRARNLKSIFWLINPQIRHKNSVDSRN
jgi:hypothetical protein